MQSGHKSLGHLAELLADARLEIGEPAAPALIELLEKVDAYRRAGYAVWVTLIQEARRGVAGNWCLDADAEECVRAEIESLIEDFERIELERARWVKAKSGRNS